MEARFHEALGTLIDGISEQNYDRTFARLHFWFEITQTYSQKYPDQILDTLLRHRGTQGINPACGELIHSTAHLIIRFAGDAESDNTLAPYAIGLQDRLCASILQEFLWNGVGIVRCIELGCVYSLDQFLAVVNFIARWANLGFVEEFAVRNHILQSLISDPARLYDHQALALIILFKLAGATFEKYVDPSEVDHCFERLKGHYSNNPIGNRLVQVGVISCSGWPQPG